MRCANMGRGARNRRSSRRRSSSSSLPPSRSAGAYDISRAVCAGGIVGRTAVAIVPSPTMHQSTAAIVRMTNLWPRRARSQFMRRGCRGVAEAILGRAVNVLVDRPSIRELFQQLAP